MSFPYPECLSFEQVQHLAANGVTRWDADWFTKAGITDLDQMIDLAANGVNSLDAKRFTRAGITDLDQMLHLAVNGVTSLDALRFTRAGVTDPAQMLHLAANGVTGLDAWYFTEAGLTDLDQMIYLAANGVTGEDADWFVRVGITDPDQMISLAKLEPEPAVLHQIPDARQRTGNEIVDRVLSAGMRIGRFPNGTLTGLTRSTHIASELGQLTDDALDVTITLTEDEFDTTGKVTVALIRETLNIIH